MIQHPFHTEATSLFFQVNALKPTCVLSTLELASSFLEMLCHNGDILPLLPNFFSGEGAQSLVIQRKPSAEQP